MVLPDEAGIGQALHNFANAASERIRSGLSPKMINSSAAVWAPPGRHPGRRRSDRGDDTAPGTRSPDASHTPGAGAVPHAADPLHAVRPTGGDRLGAIHRVDLRRVTGTPASRWSTFA